MIFNFEQMKFNIVQSFRRGSVELSFTSKIQREIYKYTIIWLIIISGISAIFFNDFKPILLGLIFGTSIGILNFRLLAMTLEKASYMAPRQAQVYATSQYFIRYLIMGSVLFVSIKAQYLNIIGVIIGLVLIKVVVLGTNLLNDKAYYKRIFGRKED